MPSSIKPTSRKMRQHDPFCGDIPKNTSKRRV